MPPLLKIFLIWFCLVAAAQAQSLAESFKNPAWGSYVFVSTSMPRQSLVRLAREAAQTKSTLVLRGFESNAKGMDATRSMVTDVISSCCEGKQVSWVVHPKLFDRYQVKSVPAFVVAYGEGAQLNDYAKVSGDMSIANALKFIAKESKAPNLRLSAIEIYKKSFSEN